MKAIKIFAATIAATTVFSSVPASLGVNERTGIEVTAQAEETDWSKYSTNYFYNHMNPTEQAFYSDLTNAANEVMESGSDYDCIAVDGHGLSVNEAYNIYQVWRETEAQYFWVDHNTNQHPYDGHWYIDVASQYRSASKRTQARKKFIRVINEYVRQASGGKTDFDKERIVHDELIRRLVWKDGQINKKQSTASSILGNETVCAGYSAAFSVIMNYIGIPTISVYNNYHEWNEIQIDGDWYNVDATWDDQSSPSARHKYFNISDASLRSGNPYHVPDTLWENYGRPACNKNGPKGSGKSTKKKEKLKLVLPETTVTYGDADFEKKLLKKCYAKIGKKKVSGKMEMINWFYALPDAGTYSILVEFTPKNKKKYKNLTGYTKLIVKKKKFTIKAKDVTVTQGDKLKNLEYEFPGNRYYITDTMRNAVHIHCDVTSESKPGKYPIKITVDKETFRNYNVKIKNGTYTIKPEEEKPRDWLPVLGKMFPGLMTMQLFVVQKPGSRLNFKGPYESPDYAGYKNVAAKSDKAGNAVVVATDKYVNGNDRYNAFFFLHGKNEGGKVRVKVPDKKLVDFADDYYVSLPVVVNIFIETDDGKVYYVQTYAELANRKNLGAYFFAPHGDVYKRTKAKMKCKTDIYSGDLTLTKDITQGYYILYDNEYLAENLLLYVYDRDEVENSRIRRN